MRRVSYTRPACFPYNQPKYYYDEEKAPPPPTPPVFFHLHFTTTATATTTMKTLSPILEIPQEILQRIALYAIDDSPLGPPKELHSLLLTCKTFNKYLSPQNASELYFSVFSQQFDARSPQCHLGHQVARENTTLELSRRFSALRIFRNPFIDDHSLSETLWVAYLMVEDQDMSQKNAQQLVRAGFPAFLDSYLLGHLYEKNENGWPVMSEQNSLALALAWYLASDSE